MDGSTQETFEGNPCDFGHTRRLVATRRCVECEARKRELAVKRTPPKGSGVVATYTLASLRYYFCHKCNERTLHTAAVCIHCKCDWNKKPSGRSRRLGWNGALPSHA